MSGGKHENDKFIESLRDELKTPMAETAEDRAIQALRNFRCGLADHGDRMRRGSRLLRWSYATGALILFVGLAIVLWPAGNTLAQTHEAIRSITSMTCDISIFNEGEKPLRHKIRWVAPDRIRVDFGGPGQFMHETRWIEGTKVTVWDHRGGSAYIVENMPRISSPAMRWVEAYSTPSGIIDVLEGPWVDLGEVEVEGRIYAKYEIEEPEGGPLKRLLVDPATSLPFEIGSSFPNYEDGEVVSWTSHNQHFSWNVSIPDSVMMPELPEGMHPRTIDGSSKAIPHAILAGVGVGPIRMGMSVEEVVELWGEPDEDLDGGTYNYFDHGVQLFIDRNGLRIISCLLDTSIMGAFKTFSGATPEGLGIGATEAEIVAAMGKPDKNLPSGSLGLIYDEGIRFYLSAPAPGEPSAARSTTMIWVIPPTK